MKVKKDRDFEDYPDGTKAFAIMGGHWIKGPQGWRWFTGDTFPRPGGDFNGMVELPTGEE